MKKRFTKNSVLRVLFAVAALGVVLVPLHPVNNAILRLGWLGSIVVAWVVLFLWCWKFRPARYGLLGMPVLLAILFSLPGRDPDPGALRADYLRRMENLAGTTYVWGGESPLGIDCSGLPRRALRDSLLAHALRHGGGGPLRMFAEQWWFDASARALGGGYRGYAVPLGIEGTIATMPYDGLEPGDLAVTKDGVHVLVYLGEDRWIQADPGIGAVAILHGRKDENVWFASPVTMHRWSILAGP